eukprot:gene19141-24980_t
MVKLYYSLNSSGEVSFIAAYIAGNVPTLVLDDGTVLNEGAAVLQWIADQVPGTIAPDFDSKVRYLTYNHLNFIATELQPSIAELFVTQEEVSKYYTEKTLLKLQYLNDKVLPNKNYIVGDKLSIVDIYLYNVLSWTQYINIDLTLYPEIDRYYKDIDRLDSIKLAVDRMKSTPEYTIDSKLTGNKRKEISEE